MHINILYSIYAKHNGENLRIIISPTRYIANIFQIKFLHIKKHYNASPGTVNEISVPHDCEY
jgi:hypothetical protein